MQFSGFFLLIICFSLLKYTYYYNYRSHISLQVGKLAKSAGVQILIFPTVSLPIPIQLLDVYYTTVHVVKIIVITCSINCIVVISKYIHLFPSTNGNL